MHTQTAKLTFHIKNARSLKDKRQISRSIIDRARRRYNAGVAEVGTLDAHKTLTIGVAVVSGEFFCAQNLLDEIVRFMEEHADILEATLIEDER